MDRPRPGWPPLPASCQPADAAARRRSSLAPPGGLADTSRPTSRASRPAPSPPTSRRCWRRSARSSRRAPSRARSASARSSHSPAAGTLPVATTAGNPQRLASHARVRWRIDLYAVARIRVKANLWKGRDSSGLQTVTTLVSIERRVHWRDCRQMPTHPACSRCYTWPPQVCRRKATTPQPRLIGALIADRLGAPPSRTQLSSRCAVMAADQLRLRLACAGVAIAAQLSQATAPRSVRPCDARQADGGHVLDAHTRLHGCVHGRAVPRARARAPGGWWRGGFAGGGFAGGGFGGGGLQSVRARAQRSTTSTR
jgi:hypothetical protein